jgi:hypothetical protein
MRDEALQSWLKKLVDRGKITQEQAYAYLKWWQPKPSVQLPGGFGPGFGAMMERGGGPCWGHSFPIPDGAPNVTGSGS